MGQNFFAPLPCALAIGALWDTSKYKKVSCSEPLGVTILLLFPCIDLKVVSGTFIRPGIPDITEVTRIGRPKQSWGIFE